MTADNVEADIARRNQELDQWLAMNPYVAEVVDRLKFATGLRDRLAVSVPRQSGERYRGFRIIEFVHRFYAVPAYLEPYDLLTLLRGEYQPMAVAGTRQGVIDEIDRRGLHSWTLVPADLVDGTPISSGGSANSPAHAFDGDPDSFWLAPERGREIKGHSWIGYAFATPQAVRRVRLSQPPAPTVHQDRVMIQSSPDGVTWTDALAQPAEMFGSGTAVINLPETTPATHWRIVAAGDDASTPSDTWAVFELNFFVRSDGPEARNRGTQR